MKIFLTLVFILICTANLFAQTEILTNNEVILMTKAGLSRDLIARKIKDSSGRYDTATNALIELKKAGVEDEIIALMLTSSDGAKTQNAPAVHTSKVAPAPVVNVVLDAKEALANAKTVAIEKSTINPSRQSLEKELLKRADWQKLKLNIVRQKESADLFVEIGFVPLSVITHRYVFRVYDRKSGTVIAAGETTSWGSLSKNLAREISKKLTRI